MPNPLYGEKPVSRTTAPNSQYELEADLREWGRWKRNCVIGLGFKSSSIEHQIMKGEIFGDGNSGSKRGHPGVTFKESPVAERVDIRIRLLSKKYPNECQILKMVYVMQWSNRKIAAKGEISRSQTLKLKERGIILLMGMEASQPKSRPLS